MAGPGDFVKVTYHGRTHPVRNNRGEHLDERRDEQTPLALVWNARRYEIPVNGSQFVPFEAMANAFGDPRSTENMSSYRDEAGNVGFIVDRATELRRLRTLYDNQFGNESEVKWAPEATVEDLEGNPIRTVLDDPQGEAVTPVTTTALDRDQLLAQVQRQQRMIELLAQQAGIDLNNPHLVAQEPAAPPEEEPDKPVDPFAELPEDK